MKSPVSPVFWVCSAIVIGMMGTALISPLYGLYKSDWGLLPSEISLIYVVYMMGAVLALLTLGGLADLIGYRPMLAASILFALVGTAISMLSTSIGPLLVGRFLVGIASSLSTAAGAVALRDSLPPERRDKAAVLFSLLMASGFGLGPLMGGVFGEFAPAPLISTYIPTLICGVVALIGLMLFVQEPPRTRPALKWRDLRPKLTQPARGGRMAFYITCGASVVAFAVFGLYAAMTPLLVQEMMGLSGPLISGLSLAAIFAISVVTQILMQRRASVGLMVQGYIGMMLGVVALLVNLSLGSVALFAFGVAVTAMGHASAILGSFKRLSEISTQANHGGLTSSYMMIGFGAGICAVQALGALADHWGITRAVELYGLAVLLVSGLCVAANLWHRRAHP